ncbi:hypothetical protein MZ018_04915 [Shewanella sp. JNE10-2]|uniref:hypothetical protein n=1 Tax=unclassified Shewanella TaxID=196818 RepID=UPI002004CB62|nr:MULTISPECIES: hypothetical protein [unclassified Shewanella]MCK7630863.1 hypothetical protein [Shewanella sp. JNE9-1]MCK7635261.1 hypothetical protein [Shewanella sp. JNE17]MCK7646177.1 hypothetical protein [Shewanella sp. JNE3-1]MCK7650487.1 hypothetical protein [Shewanella sp. JNE8]MCK7654071.1 hypothetical protein [Shewanella sp. JNE4-1]
MSKFKSMGVLSVGLLVSFVSGCASVPKQDSAIKNGVFYGNAKLSFGGNLELLAGNSEVESKNVDTQITKADVHFIELGGDTVSTQIGQNLGISKALDFLATSKLSSSGFAIANVLSNPADYPDIGHIVILKLEKGQDPSSQQMLRRAFKELTNSDSSLVKDAKCEMKEKALHCINAPNDSDIGVMRFSTLVDYSYVKKLMPHADSGDYAAYGFDDAVWTTSQLRAKDFHLGSPNVIHFFAGKYWYTLGVDGTLKNQYTYRVTQIESPNLMSVIYIYDADYKEKKIATLR